MSKKKYKIKKSVAMNQNDEEYSYWYLFLKSLAITMFEWVNVPSTIDVRYLELMLFERGNVLWFKDEKLNIYLCLQSANAGRLNVYNIPTKRHVFTASGYFNDRTANDSIIIYNNFLRTSSEIVVDRFARKLTNISRTIDVNVEAQKTPYVILCDENQKLTFKNLYGELQGNEPVIFGDKALNIDNIKTLQTNAPFIADKLEILQTNIFNDAMTFFGINNANQDKKERLVESEVSANDEQIEQARFIMLEARKQACKQINEMFGLNIDVRFRNRNAKTGDDAVSEVQHG